MKVALICSLVALTSFSFAQAAEKKVVPSRKPANSAWIYCTAYTAENEELERIEFGEDSRLDSDGPFVKLLGNSTEVSGDFKISEGIKFKVNSREASLKMKEGKVLQKSSWARGETRVFEITANITYNGGDTKAYGTCISYNY